MIFCSFCVMFCKTAYKPAVHVTIMLIVCAGCFGLRYHHCREPNPRNQQFTIDECLSGQVIDVESAIVGYSMVSIPGRKITFIICAPAIEYHGTDYKITCVISVCVCVCLSALSRSQFFLSHLTELGTDVWNLK